ncbi:MAG: carbohydrate porin [Bacteriovoracia bacterium]
MKLMLLLCILMSTRLYAQSTTTELSPEIKKYIDEAIAQKAKEEKATQPEFPTIFHGYFRSGTNQFVSGGGRDSGSCFALNYPRNDGLFYRLGNECRDYAEFSFSKIMKQNGVEVRPFFMLDLANDSRSPNDTETWSRRNRQLFVEIKGIFGNNAALWVGRRYYRSDGDIGDIHMLDGFHVQSSGNGFGVTDVPFAGGIYNFALIGYGSDDEDTNVNEQNYLADIRANYVRGNQSFQVAIQNLFISTADDTANRTAGRTFTLQWQKNTKLMGHRLVGQYAEGSMAENPGCFGTDGNCFNAAAGSASSAYRVFSNAMIDWGSALKFHTLLLYQESKDYMRWTSIGVRPHYMLSKYWSLLGEVGLTRFEKVNAGSFQSRQDLDKYTLALQASTDASQFWTRPSIRFYYSYFDWNRAAATQSTLTLPGQPTQKSAGVIGAQTEIWF